MTASISTDILAIFALCFTIFLAERNIVVNKEKNKIYIWAAATVIVLLFLEIATILLQMSSSRSLVMPHILANVIGFSLCPVVPFILLNFNSSTRSGEFQRLLLRLPILVNTLICALSFKTGWIFFVDGQNHYTRGSLFILPLLVSLFYFGLLIMAIFQNDQEYDSTDKKILIPILLLPVPGIVLQILFHDVLLIWGSIAISLLLYYTFLRELQFKYDVQTGIKNRRAFEKEMAQYLNGERNAVIVVADINNLKSTNDRHGHNAGDELIKQAAYIIRQSFQGVGKAFRIGGDEFCIICHELPEELLVSTLQKMEQMMAVLNQQRRIKIALAYGYSFYNKNGRDSIYDVFSQADAAMYRQKAAGKQGLIKGTAPLIS